MRRITQLAAKLDYNQIMVDASNRLHAIINACINKDDDSIICNTYSSMYSCEKDIPVVEEEKEQPVLDQDLCFSYRGYQFELSSCNNITDRYVCWMYGHKDHLGHTKEEVDELEYFAPSVYLVPGAWSWGAESYLRVGAEVDPIILEAIDKFLDSFKE